MLQKIINKLNDLRPKQLLALAAIASVLMFITIILGMKFLTKEEVVIVPQEKPQEVVIEKTQVVVAKINIPPRTIIQENMLQMKEIPVDIAPADAIKNFSDVQGVQVKVSIFAGDILTIQKVFSEKTEEGFTGSIPPDCRAVSISVNDLTGVDGFAKAGDRVDLLLVEKGQYSATTNIILQNVPILSINQDSTGATRIGENGVPISVVSNPSIATFALTPIEILKLISATKLGDIYMTLRPANPRHTYVGEMEYTIESINAPKPEPAPEPPVIPNNAPAAMPLPQLPLEPPVPKIEIIQGDQIVQSSTPTSSPAPKSSTANSQLPAIPSGSTPTFTPPPVPTNTPLANSPVINQVAGN